MLESFFQSQKFSVMRGLKRKFFKYLTYYRNDFELLFYLVGRLVRDYLTSHGTVTDDSGEVNVEIDLADFNARAREMGIANTGEFLSSKAFKDRGFSVNQDTRRILKVL
uniref:DNA replication licensing factor MCM2-like winged-helix domain-containing protein n=1 Tax=Rhodosorus marinus TaxID=101924 RepID=A0A7S0G2X2_9RHOD|mmetsp:Transcript_16965/g.24368  ORF Transcript_16965/g.24368 Transcript_16965/m.24368 type:complete len:109 (+) Transcript_16965:1-327(+)